MKNAVGVDVERDFDLRQAARRRRNAFKVELAEELVGGSHFAFALVDLDGHGRLVVFSGREHLAVLRRNRRVALDHRGHHAAERLNAERKRGDVEQEHGAAFFLLAGLIALVLAMSAQFSRRDPAAAWLCAPYLLWLLFAAYLNLGVWLLNR